MMNRVFNFALTILFTISSLLVVAQNGTWMNEVKQDINDANYFFELYGQSLGLSDSDAMILVREESDKLGWTHQRFQQTHNGILVDAAEWLLHFKDQEVKRANGVVINGLPEASTPGINSETAIALALNWMDAEVYSWEVLNLEALIKRIKNNPDASYYPDPQLVWSQKEFSKEGSDYRLCWRMDVHSAVPQNKKTVYIDAQSGEVYFALEGCMHNSVEGTAETMYHGTQTIVTDSIAPDSFRLVDMTRGQGIETYNLQESTNPDDAVDFYDSDNHWDNFNTEMDHIAGDVHWSSEVTYDYFLNVHDRDSYDGEGSPIVSYVHYGEGVMNAFWNGSYASYGDGGSEPFTYIDIIGHELAHGVTGNSAQLVYQNESGALNESFSDIFGTMVEWYGLGGDVDWNIGTPGNVLRRMDDPNAVNDPDTYLGEFYYLGEFDYGGVHTNSSVQNYWFYLLSQGGEGVNGINVEYLVEAIGTEAAEAIAFRNLTVYLTSSSNHHDARMGSLNAAADLYGYCSNEVLQTAAAWHAVGVGEQEVSHDMDVFALLSPESNCELSDHEEVTISFKYGASGCDEFITESQLVAGYQLNGNTPVLEIVPLDETIGHGDTVTYTFSTPADLSANEIHNLSTWVSLPGDQYPINDSILGVEILSIYPLSDAEVMDFQDDDFTQLKSYTITNRRSAANPAAIAGNSSSRGFILTGRDVRLWSLELPESEDDNFVVNPNHQAELCMCMDTEGWENVRLSFDMKQTFSEYYWEEYGELLNVYASSMRITVNGEPITGQYHPETVNDDPYLTRVINLDEYAGQEFDLCFQGKHYISNADDDIPSSPGDNTYLDNIFFTSEPIVGVEEYSTFNLGVYPNPNLGEFTVLCPEQLFGGRLEVFNNMGQQVMFDLINAQQTQVDLTGMAKGLYIVRCTKGSTTIESKVLID